MQIGAFSSSVAGETIGERLAELARLGYDFVELSAGAELVDGLPGGAADGIRAASRSSGVPVRSANLETFPQFAESCVTVASQKEAFRRLDLASDLLAEWGPGGVLLLPVWEPGAGDEVAAAYREHLGDAADRAAARAVRLALGHIASSHFCPKASDILDLVTGIGHRNLGLYLDIGNAESAGEDPVRILESAGDHLFQIHLTGSRGVPFEEMPLADIAMLLGAMSYQGRAVVEIPARGDNEHLARAIELLRKEGFA